jgi:hypothetical protein
MQSSVTYIVLTPEQLQEVVEQALQRLAKGTRKTRRTIKRYAAEALATPPEQPKKRGPKQALLLD